MFLLTMPYHFTVSFSTYIYICKLQLRRETLRSFQRKQQRWWAKIRPSSLHSFSADTRVFRIPPFHTKSSGQPPFSYQAPATWNQLPVSVRHATSVSSLKSPLKPVLLKKRRKKKRFLQSHCPEIRACARASVCVCVCVRARARVRARALNVCCQYV